MAKADGLVEAEQPQTQTPQAVVLVVKAEGETITKQVRPILAVALEHQTHRPSQVAAVL
jgi:hypothetical protein